MPAIVPANLFESLQRIASLALSVKRCALLAVVPVFLVLLAGCQPAKPIVMKMTDRGLVRDKSKDGYVPPWDTIGVDPYVEPPGLDAQVKEMVNKDPLLRNVKDPYQDPYLRTKEGEAELEEDSELEKTDPLANPNRPSNWYWVRGNIMGGEVEIIVNNRSIGRFAVHIDREITDNLHRGYNTVTFKPYPDIKSQPVGARLEIVYSQQTEGEPPVIVYDTEQIAEREALSMPTRTVYSDYSTSAPDPYQPWNPNPEISERPVIMQLYAH